MLRRWKSYTGLPVRHRSSVAGLAAVEWTMDSFQNVTLRCRCFLTWTQNITHLTLLRGLFSVAHLCSTAEPSPWRTFCPRPSGSELSRCSRCPEATTPATGRPHGSCLPGTELQGERGGGVAVINNWVNQNSKESNVCLFFFTWLRCIVQVLLKEGQRAHQVWSPGWMERLVRHKLSRCAAQLEKPWGEVEFSGIWERCTVN